MTTSARLFVVVSFLLASLVSVHAQAALPWPETAVKNLQMRLKKGLCPAQADDKLAQDICAAYGLTKKTKATGATLSKPNSAMLVIEQGGRLVKLERGDSAGHFVINRVKIDVFQAKTQLELKALIAPALEKQTAQMNLFIDVAFASPLNPEIPALIQQLVAETNQLENCGLYLDFGKKCSEGMDKVLAEIKNKKKERAESAKSPNGFQQLEGRASYATQMAHMNGHLGKLYEQLERSVFPSLQGYDTVRMCAIQRDSRNGDQLQINAEASLKECREKVRKMVAETGGYQESKETESFIDRMLRRMSGRTDISVPADESFGGRGGGGSLNDGTE